MGGRVGGRREGGIVGEEEGGSVGVSEGEDEIKYGKG